MGSQHISLFKKFHVERDGQALDNMGSRKVQELLSYLLPHRDRLHHREESADRLWGDSPSAQLKKSLRQTLWQLQASLSSHTDAKRPPVLLTDSEWVGINPAADIWLDAAVFEEAFTGARSFQGHQLNADIGQTLQNAALLYRGDLLENWYQDWCLYQRERLQSMYLDPLGKLMGYCEANRIFDAGINYGQYILFYDQAHEHTHRNLMRLLYLAGDRTGAIRQYQRCIAALDEELGVKSSKSTVVLYEQIREDQLDNFSRVSSETVVQADVAVPSASDALTQLQGLQGMVADLQRQLQFAIQAIGISSIHHQR
jgi:DNA-binding SARP family transcriptional activator